MKRSYWRWLLDIRYNQPRNKIQMPKHIRPRFGAVPDDGHFYRIVSLRYICFTCRKSWRKHQHSFISKCPHCGGEIRQVCPMFRTPRMSDKKAWRQIEAELARRNRALLGKPSRS